jgi:hypothetical protein
MAYSTLQFRVLGIRILPSILEIVTALPDPFFFPHTPGLIPILVDPSALRRPVVIVRGSIAIKGHIRGFDQGRDRGG